MNTNPITVKPVEQGQSSAPTTVIKSEVYHIDPRKDRLALLAIAASLNATIMTPLASPDESFVHVRVTEQGGEAVASRTGYKGILLMGIEDYFLYEEKEASQFNKAETIALIERLSETQILQLLHQMGKCPYCLDHDSDGDRWLRFMNALSNRDYEAFPWC